MIKAVVFDLYETLITEFIPDFKPPKRSLAERMGIPEDDFQGQYRRLNDEWEIGKIGDFKELLVALCRELGHQPDDSVIDVIVAERSKQLMGFFNIDPTIIELVREIKSMGLRIGVVTNVANLDFAGWPDSELAPLIEHTVTSFEVGVRKPESVIYEHCLEALDVKADETVYVGDGGNNELLGAHRLGMTPRWATWFLDRWPYGIRPGAHSDTDEWRQFPDPVPPYPRMKTPGELVDWLKAAT